eukprot:Skav223815  [mRNA]  locus=scaffold575:960490:961419:+ [translate_table: standard]
MCGAGYSGSDCSLRYFSPGGLATPEGPAEESPFAVVGGGLRADQLLEQQLGPEPRIGLDFEPVAERLGDGGGTPGGCPWGHGGGAMDGEAGWMGWMGWLGWLGLRSGNFEKVWFLQFGGIAPFFSINPCLMKHQLTTY